MFHNDTIYFSIKCTYTQLAFMCCVSMPSPYMDCILVKYGSQINIQKLKSRTIFLYLTLI